MTPDADDAAELDESGIPDLEGPLPDKAATGDPQEGVPPPSELPHSFDWGVTDAEQQAGEPLSIRAEHERPEVTDDRDPVAGADDEDPIVLIDDTVDGVEDVEKDLVADAAIDEPSRSAEEAAIHVTDEPPGAYDAPDDDY